MPPIAYQFVLSIIFIALSMKNSSAETFHLTGKQKEGHVVVDLSKDTLILGTRYTIGKGKSLTITGTSNGSNITSTNPARKLLYLTVGDGTLYFGQSPHSNKSKKKTRKKKNMTQKLYELPSMVIPVILFIMDKEENNSTVEFNHLYITFDFQGRRIKNYRFSNSLLSGFQLKESNDLHLKAINSTVIP